MPVGPTERQPAGLNEVALVGDGRLTKVGKSHETFSFDCSVRGNRLVGTGRRATTARLRSVPPARKAFWDPSGAILNERSCMESRRTPRTLPS